MNVVGKVGSLITQGVYSVATPFHPFGGAVDVIVVQQQDGTFRSTPWYVRFGKFQGVLKGTEKIVRINVNGVEANFHMYLDNAGEAYFVKEVDDRKEDLNNSGLSLKENGIGIDNKNNSKLNSDDIHGHRLDHSVSDSGVLQLKDNCESSDLPRFQRAESDVDRRYYEFEEDQSSFEGAIELSEYGSGRYENLDGENFVDSPGSHPEMVLVSVDGHILTAPISESEQSTDDVELGTPQFHLGPGEVTGFCEDNEFCSEENAWAANYISNLDASTSGVSPSNHCHTGVDNNVSKIQHEVCQGEGEHTCDETLITENQEDPHMPNVSDELAVGIKKKAVFQSCLELQEFAQKVGNASMEFQNLAEESNANFAVVDENEHRSILQSKIDELPSSCGSFPGSNEISNSELEIHEFEKNASGLVDTNSGFPSVSSDTELNGEHISKTASIEGVDDSQQNPTIEDDCNKGEIVESQPEITNEWDKSHSGVEMSLCGHELKGGMGLVAAAKAFEAHQRSAEDDVLKSRNGDSGSAWSGRRWRLWPIPFRKVKTIEHTSSNVPNEDVFVDSESVLQNSVVEPTPTSSSHGSPRKQFIRTNVPTNEQIESLNLKEGQNFIIFNFSTRVLGAQQVDAHIYLWKWNARIVISDVDGTITKSDVLGQFMPLVGRDWAQSGVARLFSAIKENGYQLLFLSARAIVQAYLTRNFLLNLKQDGKALPEGPIVISPDGLFPSLFREVIRRAPHEFKIACLEDIKNLFPSDYNPFYAGFGNRDTDELSYRKIGIPKGKIFIINPKGEVAISSHRIDVKSYTSLHTLVNDMFPPTSLVEQEDFNSWNFWKMPLPDID